MAIYVKLNQVNRGYVTPILVNLDKVCLIKQHIITDENRNEVERAKLYFGFDEPRFAGNPNEIITIETREEIYSLIKYHVSIIDK